MIEEHTYTLRLDPERIRVAMHDLASLTYKIAFEDDQQRRVVVQGVPERWFHRIADEYADNDEELKHYISRLVREVEAKDAARIEVSKDLTREQAERAREQVEFEKTKRELEAMIEAERRYKKKAINDLIEAKDKIKRQGKALHELDVAYKRALRIGKREDA